MKSSENREVSLPHSTLTDPRERIANMRRWNEANLGDYWQREADFWEGLVEQYQALESAARGISDYLAHVGAEETDEIRQLAARLWTVLNSNPAKKPDAPPVNPSIRLDRRGRIIK